MPNHSHKDVSFTKSQNITSLNHILKKVPNHSHKTPLPSLLSGVMDKNSAAIDDCWAQSHDRHWKRLCNCYIRNKIEINMKMRKNLPPTLQFWEERMCNNNFLFGFRSNFHGMK